MDAETITLASSTADGYEIALKRRFGAGGSVDELIVNGAFAMDSAHTASEIALAESLGPHPGHVLVGGLGLGFTPRRLLDMGASSVDVVELSSSLIDWAHQGLTENLKSLVEDKRVTIRLGDVAEFLREQPTIPGLFGPWNGICLDVDNGPDFLIHEANAKLYTIDGIRSALNHLTPGGRLAIWAQGPSKEFWYDLTTIDEYATERLIAVEHGNRKMDYAIYTVTRADNGES